MDRGEPCFHPRQLARIDFEPLAIVAQHATGLIDADARLVDQRDDVIEVLVMCRGLPEALCERGQT